MNPLTLDENGGWFILWVVGVTLAFLAGRYGRPLDDEE